MSGAKMMLVYLSFAEIKMLLTLIETSGSQLGRVNDRIRAARVHDRLAHGAYESHHGEVRRMKGREQVEQKSPLFTRQMVLLKYEAEGRQTFFIIDHNRYNADGIRSSDEANAEQVAYFFESHSCPTNWLSKCVCVVDDGDPDPHGFLKFVRVVDVPQDFDCDCEDSTWPVLFPEAFKPGDGVEGVAMADPTPRPESLPAADGVSLNRDGKMRVEIPRGSYYVTGGPFVIETAVSGPDVVTLFPEAGTPATQGETALMKGRKG